MRHFSGGLLKQQALRWYGQVDAAAGNLLGEAEVVARGVVAEQGEVEAVFARGGAVASAAVAAGAEEDRHDVEAEADGARGGGRWRGLCGPLRGRRRLRGERYEENCQIVHTTLNTWTDR